MHLKGVKLRGFKSFVDPVEIRLEPGVAVVIGPNGSGKSNVSDAILWATGSLSPHELRAEKPDDVLFGGSAERKAVDFCEVELLFDNEDGDWPELPFAEVSIARRLHRGGEGQYLVNRSAVRRLDRVELKLARVATQVERARDLEDEVRKRLRPLALQATASERAEKLAGEIASLQAAIATLDLAALAERRAEAETRRE